MSQKYTAYIELSVFNDVNANVFCNMINQILIDIDEQLQEDSLAVVGGLSEKFSSNNLSGSMNGIEFITNSKEAYVLLYEKIKFSPLVKNIVFGKEKMLIETKEFSVVIILSENINIKNEASLYMNKIKYI